jgi:hypothetical protein
LFRAGCATCLDRHCRHAVLVGVVVAHASVAHDVAAGCAARVSVFGGICVVVVCVVAMSLGFGVVGAAAMAVGLTMGGGERQFVDGVLRVC